MENKIEYLIGKEQDFYDFLYGITKKDKVAIISHIDLDGISSAIFLQEILKSKGIKPKVLEFTSPEEKAFENLLGLLKKKKITKVFISDLSVGSCPKNFSEIRKSFDVFLIDHHPFEIADTKNILKTKTEHCAAWIIYNLGSKITNLEKWKTLVCATMVVEFSFNNENNFNFLKENFPDVTKGDIIDSEIGKISNMFSFAIIYLKKDLKKAFNLIRKNNVKKLEKFNKIVQEEFQLILEKFKKEAEIYPEKNIHLLYYNPKFPIGSTVITHLSVQKSDKTFLFASDSKEDNNFIKVSSRNQSGNVDLNALMKKGIEGLENASAGGHLKASAAKFLKKDLEKFKENILS
jgi:single-stranded DNA-specific DHH superfamily exonuclease